MDIKKGMEVLNKVASIIKSKSRYRDTVHFAGGVVDVEGTVAKAWAILRVSVGEANGMEYLKMRIHQDGITSLKSKGKHLDATNVKEIFYEGVRVGVDRLAISIDLGNKSIEKKD